MVLERKKEGTSEQTRVPPGEQEKREASTLMPEKGGKKTS